jgi:hypothetical protein
MNQNQIMNDDRREDRDSYIVINMEQIIKNKKKNHVLVYEYREYIG